MNNINNLEHYYALFGACIIFIDITNFAVRATGFNETRYLTNERQSTKTIHGWHQRIKHATL